MTRLGFTYHNDNWIGVVWIDVIQIRIAGTLGHRNPVPVTGTLDTTFFYSLIKTKHFSVMIQFEDNSLSGLDCTKDQFNGQRHI